MAGEAGVAARETLNAALKKTWRPEWEIPREADANGRTRRRSCTPTGGKPASPARRRSTPPSLAKAEFEYLYDKPYEDKKKVRVAGPFTVESLSPHRMLGVDEDDELDRPSWLKTAPTTEPSRPFDQMILENLKTAGVQQAHKEDRITFTALTPGPAILVCAEGRLPGRRDKRSAPPSSSARSSAPSSAPTWSPPPARPAMPTSMC